MFLVLEAFIVACGTTHLVGVWTLRFPTSCFSAGVKMLPAGISLATALLAIAAELRRQDPSRAVESVVTSRLSAEGDAYLLRIAMKNLLGKAWKFTAQCDRVQIQFDARMLPDRTKFYAYTILWWALT
jgi:hypothetical protein